MFPSEKSPIRRFANLIGARLGRASEWRPAAAQLSASSSALAISKASAF
jgi:hypothetical protein